MIKEILLPPSHSLFLIILILQPLLLSLLFISLRKNKKCKTLYQEIFKLAGEGIIVGNNKGFIVDVNHSACNLIGISYENLINNHIEKLPWLNLESNPFRFDLVNKGETVIRTRSILLSNNTTRIIEMTSKLMPNGNYQSILRDVTETKEKEAQLYNEKKLFELVIENLPVMLFLKEAKELRFILMNKTGEKLIGYTKEQLLGKNDYDFFPKEQADFFTKKDKDTLNNKKAVNITEEYIQTKNQGERILKTLKVPVLDDVGEPKYLLGFSLDITENKKTEIALRNSEEKYRLLFEYMSAGFALHEIIFDEKNNPIDYRFLEINTAFEKLTGKTQKEIVGRTVKEIMPNTEDYWIQTYGKVATTGIPVSYQNYSQELNRYFDVKAFSPSKNKFAVIFNDITDIKLAEEEKDRMKEQLAQKQKMESIGSLAGGIAHDFNNMLGVILGHTDMAIKKTDKKQSIFNSLQEIRKAAKHSAELTKQLLTFARKQTTSPKIIDINEAIQEMMSMLQQLIGENIFLAWFPGKNIGMVKIDPSQFDQIITNLCINAKEAITNTGKITIETSVASFDEEYCKQHTNHLPGNYVQLIFNDNGSGMDESILSKIFEPFFTTKGVGKGTGLGLATVYGIVKQNKGFINVFSKVGSGTTFKVYLPRFTKQDISSNNKENKVQIQNKNIQNNQINILLVEDEPMVMEMTTTMLEIQKYNVIPAKSPEEAIKIAENNSNKIDILITDLIMPKMNGKELAEKILSSHPNTKCLFMSGYTADVIAKHGVLEEDINFIEKPFTMEELSNKIIEILNK